MPDGEQSESAEPYLRAWTSKSKLADADLVNEDGTNQEADIRTDLGIDPPTNPNYPHGAEKATKLANAREGVEIVRNTPPPQPIDQLKTDQPDT